MTDTYTKILCLCGRWIGSNNWRRHRSKCPACRQNVERVFYGDVLAIIEPPTPEDSHWVISAPAVRYAAQGATRAEAVRNFKS